MTFYKGRLAILSLNESSSDEIEHTLPEHETPNKSAERNSKRKLTHPKGGIKLQLSCSRMRSWQTLTVPPSPHKTILNTAWFSILMYELDKELMEARVRFFLAGRNSVGQSIGRVGFYYVDLFHFFRQCRTNVCSSLRYHFVILLLVKAPRQAKGRHWNSSRSSCLVDLKKRKGSWYSPSNVNEKLYVKMPA